MPANTALGADGRQQNFPLRQKFAYQNPDNNWLVDAEHDLDPGPRR